ncbi:glycerophosphoinositol inositolphosphodiesterase GDPD2 isoform X2 [Osmerus mordax]|uniref:glycerophosphoinositol inositolphosphodiesterase GDPD2 isoform X2 n=1 Tax=Osmerus mordax TaxID=8014 RepID=UPI0035101919
MAPGESCCRICSRGLYSCHWNHPSEKKQRFAYCWFSILTLVTLLTLCWMYICLVTFNDREDVNWKGFVELKLWVNWFMVFIIISAVINIYCVLLLLFALFQVVLREPLDLHCLHKIFLFLGVLFITAGVTGMSLKWKTEWPTVLLSLQATAPFLQIGGVVALTLLSWLVFKGFHRATRAVSKVLIMVVFVLVSVAIFLSPLLITSPCLLEADELLSKPALIGHRGSPMLAPENTMMSFERSVGCNVTAFETDVQLSKDRVPFLMHDHHHEFLRRTTDVKDKFPGLEFNHSTNLSWAELESLNAGTWFLQSDPFYSVSKLSEEERREAQNQSIPSLVQLLDLAKQHHTSLIFDLKNEDNQDVDITVSTILTSGIPQNLILWLPGTKRRDVMEAAPGFRQVYSNVSIMDTYGGHHLNVKYSSLSATEIRELRSRNVSVNLWVVNERWLFSLLWCSGASSVTTNACHLLQDMTQPHWTLGSNLYRMIWITVNLMSLLIMFGLFILQSGSFSHSKEKGKHVHRFSTWNQREMSPFLPSE